MVISFFLFLFFVVLTLGYFTEYLEYLGRRFGLICLYMKIVDLKKTYNYKGLSQPKRISLGKSLQSRAELVILCTALIEWFVCGIALQC